MAEEAHQSDPENKVSLLNEVSTSRLLSATSPPQGIEILRNSITLFAVPAQCI